jgi:co-chaperonin GroES (HSP10)
MIVPLQNFVVIEQEANEMKMVNGIWLPEKQNPEKQFEGIIVAVGPMVHDRELKPGVRVAQNAWGQVVKRKETKIINGKEHTKEYVITREQDIIAILKDDPSTKASKIVAITENSSNY